MAGISKLTGLKRTSEVVTHRDGGDLSTKRLSPGVSTFEALTLERGITHDHDFENWANRIYSPQGDGGVTLADFRKDLSIDLFNLSGQKVISWNVFDAGFLNLQPCLN